LSTLHKKKKEGEKKSSELGQERHQKKNKKRLGGYTHVGKLGDLGRGGGIEQTHQRKAEIPSCTKKLKGGGRGQAQSLPPKSRDKEREKCRARVS